MYLVTIEFSVCCVMKWYLIISEEFFNMKSAVVT